MISGWIIGCSPTSWQKVRLIRPAPQEFFFHHSRAWACSFLFLSNRLFSESDIPEIDSRRWRRRVRSRRRSLSKRRSGLFRRFLALFSFCHYFWIPLSIVATAIKLFQIPKICKILIFFVIHFPFFCIFFHSFSLKSAKNDFYLFQSIPASISLPVPCFLPITIINKIYLIISIRDKNSWMYQFRFLKRIFMGAVVFTLAPSNFIFNSSIPGVFSPGRIS